MAAGLRVVWGHPGRWSVGGAAVAVGVVEASLDVLGWLGRRGH